MKKLNQDKVDFVSFIHEKVYTFFCFSFCLFFSACMEEEKPVTIRRFHNRQEDIRMTSSKVEGPKLEVYLISENEVSGEVLAKALNAQGQENRKSKSAAQSTKDDAKLLSFTFDSSLDLNLVSKYLIGFPKAVNHPD